MGSQLPSLEKAALVRFLEDNIDVFAWSTYDVPSIDLGFISYQLNVNSEVIPQKQPPQHYSQEHAKAVRVEANKLKQVGVIKEIFYSKLLANIVVIKKKNGK